MQNDRCQPGSVATSLRATVKPGFHRSDPYPKTHIVIALALSGLRL